MRTDHALEGRHDVVDLKHPGGLGVGGHRSIIAPPPDGIGLHGGWN